MSPNRGGISLLEALVVIGIITVLLALAVPAVQRVREGVNVTLCQANLSQIGKALHLFHQDHGMLPSNGGWDGQQRIQDVNGTWIQVATEDFASGQTFVWGVGARDRSPRDQTGSWAYSILPYLEQRAAQQAAVYAHVVTLFHCQSRRRPSAWPAQDDQHGRYHAGGWTWAKLDYAANALAIPNRPRQEGFGAMSDGLSVTALVGEKALHPDLYETGSWYWDEPYFIGGAFGTQRDGHEIVRDDPGMGMRFRYNWGAVHQRGANFLFADGSVRLVRHGTARNVVAAILTPRGAESAALPD